MAYTLAQFRSIIRQRLGWPTTDTFAVDTEIANYINDSLAELWALLVTINRAGTWGVGETTIVSQTGITDYLLPVEFGRMIIAQLSYSNQLVPLRQMDPITDARITQLRAWTPASVSYYVRKTGAIDEAIIRFNPPPASDGISVSCQFVLSAPVLVADTDTSWMEYDEYIILDCCMKLLIKEEADASSYAAQKAALKQRIELEAIPLDVGEAPTVADVRGLGDYVDPAYWFFRRY